LAFLSSLDGQLSHDLFSDSLHRLLLGQRETRSVPAILPSQATPHTPCNTVGNLARRFALFVRLMETDALLHLQSSRREVSNGAVELLRREPDPNHGVQEVYPFDFSWCSADTWCEEDSLQDFQRSSVDCECGSVVWEIMLCSGRLDIVLVFHLDCSSASLGLGLGLQLPRILFLRGRLFCKVTAVELELRKRRGEDLRS
jgi:hypothetical protein